MATAPLAATPLATIPLATTQAQPKITWSQAYQKRQLAQRIAEKAKKNQAAYLQANPSATTSTPGPD
jgi:hypothetical protein